jgi:long-subunit fatty acid transport protein
MTKTRVSDLYLDYGAQYAYIIDSVKGRDLKENVKLLMGATFAAQTNVKAKIDSVSYNYYTTSQGYENSLDTLENTENTKGTITFPLSFGFGLGFQKGDKWLVAADFAVQNWSTYQAFNQSASLKNSMRISLGAQYIPNSKASGEGNYPKRMHYRMGIRYAQTALELKNTQLTEYGVSAGIGFPVGRNYLLQNFSMVNIGLEIGQRGTVTNGLIKEQFFKATIGFTINDRWFVKPKFD